MRRCPTFTSRLKSCATTANTSCACRPESAPQTCDCGQQGRGRGVSRLALRVGEAARHLLAQLDAVLVEAVDAPDPALHEGLVFVQREQLAQRMRAEIR